MTDSGSDNKFEKQRITMQYTEILYMQDGEEVGRERMNDDQFWDADTREPMTDQEIEDWGSDD